MANPFTPGQKAELDAEVARLEAQLALLNKAVGTTGASTEAAPAPTPAPAPAPVPASPSAAKLPVYGRAPRPEPAPEPEMTYAPTQKGLRADPGYSPELKKYYGALLVPSTDAARIQANANTFEQFRKEGAESVNEEFAKFDADLKQSEARLRDLQRQAATYARKPTPGVAAEDIPVQLPPELAAQLKSAETEYSTLRTKRNAARILQQGVAAKAEYETYAPRAIEKTQAALEKTQDPRLSALLDYQYTMQAKALDLAKQEADALARNLKIPLKDVPISLGFDQRGRVILDTAQIEETLYYKYRDAAAQDLGFKTWDSIKDFKGMKEGKTSLALQKEADRLATQKAKAEILRAYQGSRNISLYDPDPEGTTADLADAPLVVRELMAVLTPKPARTLTPKASEIMPERSGEYFWRTLSGLGAMIAARSDAYAKSDLPTRNVNVETVGDAVSYVADTTGLFVFGRLPNTEQERAFIAKIRENPLTAAILADEMGRAYDIATDYKGDPTTKAVLQFTAGAVGFIGLDAQAPDPLTLGLLGLGGAVKALYSVPNQMNKLAKAAKAASELEDFGTAIRLVEEQSPAGAAILEQKVAVESVINAEVRGEINKLQRKVETAQEALEKIVARAREKGIDVGSGSIADAGLAREYQVAQREVAVAQLEAASAKRMALEQAVTHFDQTKKPLVRLLNAQVKRYKKAESELAAVLKEIEDFESANSTVIGFYDKLAEAENAARQKAGTAYDAYAQAKRTRGEAVVEAGKELQAAKDALAAAATEADRVAAAKRIKDAEKAVRELGKRAHPLTSAVTTAKAEADLALEEAKTAGSARAKYQSEHIDKFAAQNKMETRARLARERMGSAEGILRTNGVDPTAPVIVDEAVRAKLAEDLKIVTGAERGLKQTLADSEKIIGNIERVIGAAASVENAAERSIRWRKTFARFAEEVQQGGQRYGTVAKRMEAQSPKFVDVLATTGPNAVARTASAAEEAAGIERVLARGGREYLTTLAAKMSDDPEKVVDLLLRRGDALAAVAQKIAKAEGRVPLTVEEVKVLQQELEDGLRTAAATAEDDPFQVVKAIRLAERLDPNMRPSVLVTRTGLTPALRLDNLLPAIGGTVRYYAQGLDPIIAASGVGMSKTLENIIRTGRNISAQIDDELMSIIRQANFGNLDPEVARRVADALNYSLAGRALGDEVAWTNLLQKIRNKVALSDDERRVVQVAALVQYIDTTTPLAYTGGKTFVNAISGDETMWQIARRQLLNDPRIRGFLGYEAPVRTGSAPGSAGPTFLANGRKPQGPITFSRRGGGPFRRKLPSDSPEIRDPGGHPPADLNDIPSPPPGLVGRTPEPPKVAAPTPAPTPKVADVEPTGPRPVEPPPPVEPPTGGEPPAGGAPPPRGPRPQAPSPLAPKEVPPTPSPIPAELEGSVVPEGFVALVRSWLPPSYRVNLSESQVRSLERQAYKLLEQNLQEGGTFLDYMTKLQNLTRITFGSADPRITRTYGFAARAVGHARMLQAAADATKAALAPFNGQEIADVMRLFSGKYREISDYNGVLRTLNTLGQPVTVTSSASPKGGVGLGKLSLQLLRLSQEPAGEEVWTTNILLSQLEDNIPKIIKELDAQPNPGRPLLGAMADSTKKAALSWWKTSVVTGLLVPNPRYYLNNIAGDFSQMWFELGFIPAARQSFQNLPVNIPLLGRLMQNTMSELTAKAAGKPVLGTVTNALFNPYLNRVWNGTRGTIRTAQGAVFTLNDARKWMVEDGILDVFLHEELPMAFSRLVPSTWDRTLGGWQREMEQFANFVQQRQRSGLYLELLKNGYTRAEAKRMTLNALYDWKNALAEGEVMGLISSITFYRFWKLAMEQFGRAIMEPLVRPSSNLLADALRGRTRLARGRQQVQLLDQVLSPAIQSMQTQEEYQDMDTKMGDLARLIYPSWMRDRSLAFSHALSPEYARQLATTRGYYVSDAAITMPRFTVLDTAAMTSAMFMPLVTVAGKAAGFETTPDWKEQMFTPFLEQLDPLTREGIDAIMDTYNPMSTGGKTARVTPGEALVLDRMHSLFSTPRVEGEFVDRDPRTGTLEANPLELTAMRLVPFFGTQLTRLFDNAYGENPASIIAYNRNMKIAQLRSAAQLESDPEKAASYAKEAAALDAQQGETIADAAGWMMLRTLGVGPYTYTVNDQVARVTKGVAATLDPKTSKFKEPEFGGYIFEEEPVEAEDVMETVAP